MHLSDMTFCSVANTPTPLKVLKRRIAAFIAALVAALVAWATTGQSVGQEYSILDDSTVIGRSWGLPTPIDFTPDRGVGDVSVVAESLVYAKNLELTGSPNIDGETFIGTLNPIRLNYLASDQIQLELGGYFGSNYGDDESLDVSEPLVRLIIQTIPDHYLVAGSLIQSHWMVDALQDDVNNFQDTPETGLQYRVNLPWIKSDSWIDWRVRETATRSEQFEGASANQIRLGRLWLDGQFLWSHTGGQKNSMNQIINNSTGMLGLSLGIISDVNDEYIARVGANFLATNFESRTEPNSSGQGIEYWSTVDLLDSDIYQLQLFGRHFDGDQLYSLRGDPLYQFNQYSQLGFNWVATMTGNLNLEFGFVGQYADDTLMNTYQINFVWSNRFRCFNQCCDSHSRLTGLNFVEQQ